MGPFVRSKDNNDKIEMRLLISLLPIIIYLFYKNALVPFINGSLGIIGLFYPLVFILVGIIFSYMFELGYAKIIKKDEYKEHIKESYNILYPLMLSMVLSFKLPIYGLILGEFIFVSIKVLFNFLNKDIFNPIVIASALVLLIFGFSNSIFFQYELVNSYKELFNLFGFSSILYLISFIYLFVTKTIKWKITISYVFTTFLITYVIGSYLNYPLYYPLFHILNGGLIFTSVYLAPDFKTSTVTPIGQIIQGIFLGITTVLFNYIGFNGVIISVLIINIFVPFFDNIGLKSRFNFIKSFGIFLFAWLLIVILCLFLSISNKDKRLQNDILNDVFYVNI